MRERTGPNSKPKRTSGQKRGERGGGGPRGARSAMAGTPTSHFIPRFPFKRPSRDAPVKSVYRAGCRFRETVRKRKRIVAGFRAFAKTHLVRQIVRNLSLRRTRGPRSRRKKEVASRQFVSPPRHGRLATATWTVCRGAAGGTEDAQPAKIARLRAISAARPVPTFNGSTARRGGSCGRGRSARRGRCARGGGAGSSATATAERRRRRRVRAGGRRIRR